MQTNSLLTYAPGTHTHLAPTTRLEAQIADRDQEFCWEHDPPIHRTRITPLVKRSMLCKLYRIIIVTRQVEDIEYDTCWKCLETLAKEHEIEMKKQKKEAQEEHLKKLNHLFENRLRDFHLKEIAYRDELARKNEEVRLAEEAARIVREDEIAAANAKAKVLRLRQQEIEDDERERLLRRHREAQEMERVRVQHEQQGETSQKIPWYGKPIHRNDDGTIKTVYMWEPFHMTFAMMQSGIAVCDEFHNQLHEYKK